MANEKKYERKRRRLNITLSDRAHKFLKNRVTNASKFIEQLIISAEQGIQATIVTLSPIKGGPGGIRTHDRPVMSRAL
jgi:hypothetical protein